MSQQGPEVLNYLVDHGINIEEVDVGGMGAGNGRSVLYKNISTSPEENDQFKALLDKNVNVFIQVMPNNKPVDISSYLK